MQTVDSRAAFGLAKDAYAAAVRTNHPDGISLALRTMAVTALDMGLHAEAFEHATEASRLFKDTADHSREALMQNVLGGVHYYLGDHGSRLICNRRGLELCKASGDHAGLLRALNNTADTYTRLGEYDRAMKMFEECLTLADDSTPFIQCIVLSNMGEVRLLEGNHRAAEALIERSQDIGTHIAYREIVVANLIMLAQIELSRKNASEAIDYLTESLTLTDTDIDLNETANIYNWLSEAHAMLGNFREAYENHHQFHKLRQQHLDEQKILEIKSVQFRTELTEIQNRMTRELEEKVVERTREIEHARIQIEQQAKDIRDSIDYARYIQNALLPTAKEVTTLFPDSMAVYLPRDVVSGDFYWVGNRNGVNYLAVADCTGHGVPGALLSVLGVEKLEQALLMEKEPAAILTMMNREVMRTLRQSAKGDFTASRDGMDMALISIDLSTGALKYAGAKRPLVIVNNKGVTTIAPTRFSIGGHSQEDQPFVQHELILQDGDAVYLFTDGFPDQFGGPDGRKFTSRRLLEQLATKHGILMAEKAHNLRETFYNWKGNLPQLDDVLIMGVRYARPNRP